MRKWYIIFVLLLLCIVGYNYVYKEHRDIANESPSYTLSPSELNDAFIQIPTKSEKKYLNKTVDVSGVITEVNQIDLTLGDHVFCIFNNPIDTAALKLHSDIKIKGRVIGYDDLLEQIKLDQCSLIIN